MYQLDQASRHYTAHRNSNTESYQSTHSAAFLKYETGVKNNNNVIERISSDPSFLHSTNALQSHPDQAVCGLGIIVYLPSLCLKSVGTGITFNFESYFNVTDITIV